jgi:hypothetical protein
MKPLSEDDIITITHFMGEDSYVIRTDRLRELFAQLSLFRHYAYHASTNKSIKGDYVDWTMIKELFAPLIEKEEKK